jgi:hypothetical protein
MRVTWISHLLLFCLQFHKNVCLCIMKESSGNCKKKKKWLLDHSSVANIYLKSMVCQSFMLQFQLLLHFLFNHTDQIELKKPFLQRVKQQMAHCGIRNTPYMIHCSRKVSVEYIRYEKQRKTSFVEYSTWHRKTYSSLQ